jgi:squalene-hopene/tetraprenyl-beta-curcumene cyclase
MEAFSDRVPGALTVSASARARPATATDDAGNANHALERARDRLLALQHPDGWWKGKLETNVTIDAEDMLLRHFLGVRDADATAGTAAWLRSQQRSDGSWANSRGGPGELSTTIEAYVALRLAGDAPDIDHMRMASAFVRALGGVERARVFTHIWLALFDAWPWQRVPVLPPELMLLPTWVPLNAYDFACWARQTIVALSIVLTYRPRRPLPFGLPELHGPQPWSAPVGGSAWSRLLLRLDRGLRRYQKRPLRVARGAALARAERWILDRQERDGSWGGSQPPWVYSLMALHLRGYRLDHPAMKRGLEGLRAFTIDDGGHRRPQASQSPVWDTALTILALADAGLAGNAPALIRACDWLLGEQASSRGDWAVRRPQVAPGGWALEFANGNYPDIDDTAEAALALVRVQHPQPERVRRAIDRAATWVAGMQRRDGGWGAFDADNRRALVRHLPFCDFGEIIDPPSADVTAHAVEMLAQLGPTGSCSRPAADRGREWLLQAQEADGSWEGRWGVNHIYGTGAAVPALVAAGMGRSHPSIRRAVRWLETHQNDDGGWGEDPRSYDGLGWIGRGASTASQTAWALLALDAAGERSPAVRRGVRWLVETQRPDGGWDEPQFTGTGFPSEFYINYHLYRLVFPVMALGRCTRPAVARLPSPEDVLAKADEENFPVTGILAGRHARRHLRAIYGFARLVDDLGDESGGDRGALLDWADAELNRILSGGEAEHPLMRELSVTVRECSLPSSPLRRLVQAGRHDQLITRYESFEQLLDYCQLSAAPVGELVLHVFGAATARRVRLSNLICAGLQVTEHLQDVGQDYARGRIYLPQDDMSLVGCREADLSGASAGPALRALLALQVERARSLLDQGAPLARQLPPRARMAVAAFVAGGRAALDAIQQADYDVLGCPRPRERRALAAAFGDAVMGR